jgi:predicted enzyme related to lactoylglutathione lyase
MTEFEDYTPGTPCWVDCTTTDPDGAREFYAQLFGWEPQVSGEEYGSYTTFKLRGRAVAGLYELSPEQRAQGMPPAWTAHVRVTDTRQIAELVKPAGGQLIMEPLEVPEQGVMALASDPTGAVIGFWEPRPFIGAGLANEPGSFSWNELRTHDLDAAVEFYAAVLGWGTAAYETGGGPRYLTAQVNGTDVAGMMDTAGTGIPDEVPSHWLTYFAVEDCDATIAKAESLGGTVTAPAIDTPQGRMAWLADPYGAQFAVGGMATASDDQS